MKARSILINQRAIIVVERFTYKNMNLNKRKGFVVQLFAVGMLLPAMGIIIRYFIEDNNFYALVNIIVILSSYLSITYLDEKTLYRLLKKSPSHTEVD